VGRIVLALTQPVRRSWLRRVVSCTFCWRTTFCLTPPCSWCSTSWIHRCVTPRLTTCSTSRAHPALGRRLCARPSPDSPEDRPTQFALSRSQLEMTLHLDSLPAEMRARCVPATSTQPHPVSPSTADAAACGDAQGGGFADQRADGSRRALHSDVDQVSAGTPLAAAHPLAPSTRAACACKQRIGGKRGCSATRETVPVGRWMQHTHQAAPPLPTLLALHCTALCHHPTAASAPSSSAVGAHPVQAVGATVPPSAAHTG
jgi:hypothetical protein